MKTTDAAAGVEVTHPKRGRGVITEYNPKFGGEPDEITVQFYQTGTEETLPIFAVELAETVAKTSINKGSYGLFVTVNDGYSTVEIVPNGEGDGYDVELSINGKHVDTASLSRQ